MDYPISRQRLQSLKEEHDAQERHRRAQSVISDISSTIISLAKIGQTTYSHPFGNTEADAIFLRYSLKTIIQTLTERFPDTEIIPAKVTWLEHGKATYERYPNPDFTYINGLVIDWS